MGFEGTDLLPNVGNSDKSKLGCESSVSEKKSKCSEREQTKSNTMSVWGLMHGFLLNMVDGYHSQRPLKGNINTLICTVWTSFRF